MSKSEYFEAISVFNENCPSEILQLDYKLKLCGLCCKIAIDAYIIRCGCRFCKNCLEEYLENGNTTCPIQLDLDCQNIELTNLKNCVKDELFDMNLHKFQVKCCYDNCSYQANFLDIIDHLNYCDKCSFYEEDLQGSLSTIEKLYNIQNQLENMKKQNSEMFQSKCKEFQQTIKSNELAFNELRFKISQIEPKQKVFIWKIENISDKITNSNIIESPLFPLSKYSYRLSFLMFCNGDCDENRGYLSIFFKICCGEYDDILEWPFHYDITFTMLGVQPVNRRDHVQIKRYSAGVHYVYEQPTDDDSNVYCGCPQFIMNDEISLHEFTANDTIFIQCEAMPSTN